MKQYCPLIAFILIFSNPILPSDISQSTKQIAATLNPNIETVACIINLTQHGADLRYGYGSPELRSKAMKQFSHFKSHPAVIMTETFLEKGLFHLPIWVAIHTTPVPGAKLEYELPEWLLLQASNENNSDDGRKAILVYVELLNKFNLAAHFDEFLSKYQTQYDQIKKDVISNLPQSNFISNLENYFGIKHKGYVLVPSPIFPEFAGISAAISSDEGMTIFNIFGASILRSVKDSIETGIRRFNTNDFTFNDPERIRELSTHEFAHAFIEPIADKYRDQINSYDYLFTPIQQRMKQLTYRDWYNCAVEHIIRAVEVRISRMINSEEKSQRLMRNYMDEYQFLYLPNIIESLTAYEQNRNHFQQFNDYFPEVLNAFEKIDAPKNQ